MSIFRENNTRLGLVQDNSSNFSARVYIPVDDEEKDKIAKKDITYFYVPILTLYDGIHTSFSNLDEKNLYPSRCQIFFNKEDKFYSIVLGLKLSATDSAGRDLHKLSYNVALSGYKKGVFVIYTNGWECHKGYSLWDEAHCNEGPIYDFKGKECKELFSTLIEELEKSSQTKKEGGSSK